MNGIGRRAGRRDGRRERGCRPRLSPSTDRPRPARARWRAASPPTSACPISTPVCSTARSAGACWTPAATRPTRAAAEAAARALLPPIWSAPTCAARWPMPPPPRLRRSRPCARRCWISSAISATERGAVLDGRDIGTVIFPDAAGQTVRHRHACRTGASPLARAAGQGRRGGPGHGRGRYAGARYTGRSQHAPGGRRGCTGHNGPGR